LMTTSTYSKYPKEDIEINEYKTGLLFHFKIFLLKFDTLTDFKLCCKYIKTMYLFSVLHMKKNDTQYQKLGRTCVEVQ